MKILLIDPPFKRFTGFVNYYYPVGLALLAGVLKADGHEVSILDVDAIEKGNDIDFSDEYRRFELYKKGINDDAHVVWKDVEKILWDFNPDLVGITAMTTKFGSALKAARVVKKYNSNCMVVIGGPHGTVAPDGVLASDDVDVAVRGEGDLSFRNLISAIVNKEGFSGVKGISYKENGKVIHNDREEYIANLDELPFPDRTALMHPDNYTSEDMGVIIASRGCPFTCSYCFHPWGRQLRYRTTKNVVNEMRHAKEVYGTRQFEFKDDTFTINKRWVAQLCLELISENLKINWGCTTRVDVLDDELVGLMKKSGCNIVKLGIETGSQRILDETQKGVTFEQMRNAAGFLNKYGIFWSGYFMIGLPTETEEDINKTYEFMKELNPFYAGLGVYSPFPKTYLFDQGVLMGLVRPTVEPEHFFTTNPKDYYFVDPDRRVAGIEKADLDKLVTSVTEGFHEHNTKLENILRRGWARKTAYLSDFKLLSSDVKKAVKWVLAT